MWELEQDERDLATDLVSKIEEMRTLKQESLEILGGRDLQQFWDDSNEDYAALTKASLVGDPVKRYSSTISRDKADEFIASLVGPLMYPSIVAQNQDQEIDRIVGKTAKMIVEHLHRTDGYPAESGQQKMGRYIKKSVVEGTVHAQVDMTKDEFSTSLVPNEEVLIPNFWQPNIQLQSMVGRVQTKILYQEAEQEFGHLDNWKHVFPGKMYVFNRDNPELKTLTEGILEDQEVEIARLWWVVPKNKLPSGVKRRKYYNVLINGVLMFPVGTICPYKDGYYPWVKGVFDTFSYPEFYWGNSVPNKMHEDKRFKDDWKTLIRYKGKLGALPPLISKNGMHIDESILLPGRITPVTSNVEIAEVPGISKGVTQADVAVMEMADAEIERATKAPQTDIDPRQKARASVIMEANARKLLNTFALQVSYFIQGMSYLMISRGFQYIPKNAMKKIAIPNQTLPDGRTGTYEILFEKLPDMTEYEVRDKSFEIFKEEQKSRKRKEPKNIYYVNPDWIREMTFYVYADVGTDLMTKDLLERGEFTDRFQNIYLARPDLFNLPYAARKFAQMNGDGEEILNEQGMNGAMMPQQPKQSQEQPASNMMEEAMTPLPVV